jgi:hypothetical protein
MKNVTITLLLASLVAMIFSSCTKTDITPLDKQSNSEITREPAKDNISPAVTPDPVIGHVHIGVGLEGKWKIVSDSTYSNDGTLNNSGTSYKGDDKDYFQFTGNGKLYISENGVADTANYMLSNDKTITVNYLVYNGVPVNSYGSVIANFKQVDLTANTVTLLGATSGTISLSYRSIHLKR